PVRIGSHCTIAADAFVHYGVEMGDRSALGPNAFLMKGESVPAGQTWQGNPASLAPATARTISAVDNRSARRSVPDRKRLAENQDKGRTVPWRPSPQTHPETIDITQDYREVLQRQVIIGKILTPVSASKMFNGHRSG
ncbi:MAG: hypothetical protein ABJM26_11925, partial [Anderseniella sp.]